MFRKRAFKANPIKSIEKKKFSSKVGNIGFLLAIPGIIALAGFTTALLIFTTVEANTSIRAWQLFGGGLGASILLSITFTAPKLRVLLHEIKHGVVVLLSGNSIKGMKIGRNSGHIDYTLRYDKLHFAPIICLAPYFLPLFSFPTLLCAIYFEAYHRELLLFLLGFTLGFDTSTGFYDLHPNQSDLKRIFGGFAIASIFLASSHIFWISTCLIWVEGLRISYINSATSLYSHILKILG